jgi:hypothetical protein
MYHLNHKRLHVARAYTLICSKCRRASHHVPGWCRLRAGKRVAHAYTYLYKHNASCSRFSMLKMSANHVACAVDTGRQAEGAACPAGDHYDVLLSQTNTVCAHVLRGVTIVVTTAGEAGNAGAPQWGFSLQWTTLMSFKTFQHGSSGSLWIFETEVTLLGFARWLRPPAMLT